MEKFWFILIHTCKTRYFLFTKMIFHRRTQMVCTISLNSLQSGLWLSGYVWRRVCLYWENILIFKLILKIKLRDYQSIKKRKTRSIQGHFPFAVNNTLRVSHRQSKPKQIRSFPNWVTVSGWDDEVNLDIH